MSNLTPYARRSAVAVGAVVLALLLTGCGRHHDGGPPARAGGTGSGEAHGVAATSTAPGRREFPPSSANVVHGGEHWAVYLAVSAVDASGIPDEPEKLARARQDAAAAGYRESEVGDGDVACDQGATKAMRLDPRRGYRAVSILFDTEAQAQQFVDAYESPVAGIARIKALCLDGGGES